jgi:hypothetical protein
MRQVSLHAFSTLGLHLFAIPLAALAQVPDGGGDTTMFTELVQTCLVAPAQADCTDLNATLTQCAAELDDAVCAPLFQAPAAVFLDPALMQLAQSILIDRNTTLAAVEDDAPQLFVEIARQDFRTPPDPVRQPDAGEARALEQVMADPSVAAAVARFGGHRPTAGGETIYPQAMFALQRAQRSEGATDEALEPVEVIEGAVNDADLRLGRADFDTLPLMVFDERHAGGDGGAELARAGLGSLARLAVGMQVDGGEIIARADERVVMRRPDADPVVWRDDDAILRQEHTQRWIEGFEDGSTLTRLHRIDGSWTISIRDVTGQSLWRERILADGSSLALINDLDWGTEVALSDLPDAPWRELRVSERTDPALAIALLHEAEGDARALGRTFTLRQVREVHALRALVPELGPMMIDFGANVASVSAAEATKLEAVGRLIERLIAENPRDMFLIEGHTDGTGPAANNLALSDRRAESVALALSEIFAIPPENLIVQGYGERHLRVPTAEAEAGNRRVAIRRISPLLRE